MELSCSIRTNIGSRKIFGSADENIDVVRVFGMEYSNMIGREEFYSRFYVKCSFGSSVWKLEVQFFLLTIEISVIKSQFASMKLIVSVFGLS